MSRSGPPHSRLLFTYVLTASLVAHLVAIPIWVLWLDQTGDFDATPVKVACETTTGQSIVNRPCRNPVACESSEMTVVARFEEAEEPEEPEEPEALDEVVITPPDIQPTEETTDDAHAATLDSKVTEEETVAKGDNRAGGQSRPAQPSAQPQPRQEPSEASRLLASRKRLPDAPDMDSPGAIDDERINPDQEKEDQDSPSIQELMPDFEAERLAAIGADGGDGSNGTVDYLDVSEGERTLINRRRVNYADFFERIKLGVSSHWTPGSVYKRRDPTGKIYGVGERLTILNVTLKGDGTLAQLYVEQPSGLDFLDDEAMRAMRMATPFPNPPEGLKGLDGNVSFRFGFHFEVSTNKFRLFRYR